MTSREWSLLALLSVLWGGSFVAAEVALADLPPLSVVFARVSLAALTPRLLLRPAGLQLPRGAACRPYALMALVNNAVPFSLIVYGQTRVDAWLAAILNATTPLFVVLLAHLLGTEALNARRAAALVLGVAVLVGPVALAGIGEQVGAQLAVLGAALGYACAGLYGRRFRGQPVLVTAGAQVTASSLMLLPLVLLLVTLLNPVRASALAVLLLDQWPGPRELAGMAIVGVALLVLDGRLPARLRRGPHLPPAAR